MVSRFTEALKATATFFSADVVDYEIRRYLLLKGATRRLRRYEDVIRDWIPVSLTRSDWATAARHWSEIHTRGRSIDDRDLLIAVSALKADATLVTNNVRHFEPLDLALADWAEVRILLQPIQPGQT